MSRRFHLIFQLSGDLSSNGGAGLPIIPAPGTAARNLADLSHVLAPQEEGKLKEEESYDDDDDDDDID
jgi:hypothetical protein